MEAFECYLLVATGRYTPFHEGISSPVYHREDGGGMYHTGWSDNPHCARAKAGALWIEGDGGLVVRTPGGDWYVDQHVYGRSWKRNGTPPRITVDPSIMFAFDSEIYKTHGIPLNQRRFHGVLTNGILQEVP